MQVLSNGRITHKKPALVSAGADVKWSIALAIEWADIGLWMGLGWPLKALKSRHQTTELLAAEYRTFAKVQPQPSG